MEIIMKDVILISDKKIVKLAKNNAYRIA